MSAAKVEGTPLHCPYRFSYMRRGKSSKPDGQEGTSNNNSEQGNGAAASTPADSDTGATNGSNATPPTPVTTGDNTIPTIGGVVHPYENSIKTISTVATIEEFWKTYDYLKRPSELPTTTDYHFFRGGIKPTWEDPLNARGGKWIVRLPKGLASRYWEEVILALIGGQFPGIPDGEICGAVVSIRYSEDILGIWNRTANDRDIVERLRDAIKRVLQLPLGAPMEYKPHQMALQDKSSFRNTQIWKPNKGGEQRERSDSRGHDRSDSRGRNEGNLPNESLSHRGGSDHPSRGGSGAGEIAGPRGSIGASSDNPRGSGRRSGSWGDREDRKKGRDLERAWR